MPSTFAIETTRNILCFMEIQIQILRNICHAHFWSYHLHLHMSEVVSRVSQSSRCTSTPHTSLIQGKMRFPLGRIFFA